MPVTPVASAAPLLAIALLAGCALGDQARSSIPSDEPSGKPRAGETPIPSVREGRPYDGRLLGFTIADIKALAADRGLECTPDHAFGNDISYFCTTSTPELDTPMWLRVTGHTWGDEAYNLSVFASTAPPDEQASRDAVADIVVSLMPWIADLGWYRSGDFDCGAGRQGDREFHNFGPEYSICAISSADLGGDGSRSATELDIATEP